MRAVARVHQVQDPRSRAAAGEFGASLGTFGASYDAAVPMTMEQCDRVMANCFVNASYDPALRNGTCPDRVGQFCVGFQ